MQATAAAIAGATIAVIDDERDVVELVSRCLAERGFRVLAGHSAADLRRLLAREAIDLIVLDQGLPDADGPDLAREIVAAYATPILVLSGRSSTVDKVLALELGAEDYVAKPFELAELLARVRTVLRRTRRGSAPAAAASARDSTRRFAGYSYFPGRRELLNASGARVELTGGELRLLEVFLEHPNRVLSRDRLLDLTRGREAGPFDRSVDMQVQRLRRKLEADPARPSLIRSERGEGYRFCAEIEP